jgi:O-acetyl-ADP-ribose deacetylase (regulator of RNase III)
MCYENCLAFTHSHPIRTVALCGISTGIYGYPPEKAAHIALLTVRKWLERARNAQRVDRIVFVTYTKREARIYEHLAPVYFPPVPAYGHTDSE